MFKVTSRWSHQDSIKIEWNLGKRCNYDCSYCPSAIHDNHSPHINIKILETTVDKLCELGKPVRISLTGGEPCVHPNIENLLDYFKRKNVSWVNLTTNGTRSGSWYLENSKYFNHLVFSLHFEYDWKRVLNNIDLFRENSDKDFFVNIMAHHDHIDDIKIVINFLDQENIKYAVRRIRWTDGDHDVFDDLKYKGKDLEWILKKEATAEPNCKIDNDEQLIHANDIIKKHLNQFKNWTCNAGIESLMINWDGEVYRATCRVGGSLGNIYKNTFAPVIEPIVCTRDWCTCAADIPLTKIKNDQNYSN